MDPEVVFDSDIEVTVLCIVEVRADTFALGRFIVLICTVSVVDRLGSSVIPAAVKKRKCYFSANTLTLD